MSDSQITLLKNSCYKQWMLSLAQYWDAHMPTHCLTASPRIYSGPQEETVFYSYLSQYKTRLTSAVEYLAVWQKIGQDILMPEQAINCD